MLSHFQKSWATWRDVVVWFKTVHDMGADAVRAAMYCYSLMYALAMYLGLAFTKLSYRKVWAQKNPPEFLARLYLTCKMMDHRYCARAQRKVLRLMSSAHFVPVKFFRCKVPARGRAASRAVKRVIVAILNEYGVVNSTACKQVVQSRVRVQLAAAENTSTLLSDHIRQARKFCLSHVENLPQDKAHIYEQRLDIRRLRQHTHVPIPDNPDSIASAVWSQLREWASYLQVDSSDDELQDLFVA